MEHAQSWQPYIIKKQHIHTMKHSLEIDQQLSVYPTVANNTNGSSWNKKLPILRSLLPWAVLMIFSMTSFCQTTTYSYTGGTQTVVVPNGITSISVDVKGAQGNPAGGKGGRVQATLSITAGQTLYINVGGQAGFNGGGNGNSNRKGGGASDIRIDGTALTKRVIVAGGGGGGNNQGGVGGGLTGGAGGGAGDNQAAQGGTQAAGGAGANPGGSFPGSAGSLGVGGDANTSFNGPGGGGGGYYGGGGGGFAGGGGGSSFTDATFVTDVEHTQGFQSGNGEIIITWPNVAPSFANGSPQTLSVCQNTGATSINDLLKVNDANTGQTETLTVTSAASNGTVSASYTTTSTGSTLTPTGLTYTPAAGYSGTDAFTVQVSDGTATASTTINVTVNNVSVSQTSVTNVTCNDFSTGSLTVSASGGTAPYTYTWSPRGGSAATASDLHAGQYSVKVTDSKGCSITSSKFTVTEPPAFTTGKGTINNVTCKGGSDGSARIIASGGTVPYTYLWSNGATTANASELAAGNYSCTVTDANGCKSNKNFTVGEPAAVSITLGTNPDVTSGTTTANLPYTATSGSPLNYSISWSDAAITAGFSNVSSASLTSSPIAVTVPANAAVAEYSGNLEVSNGTCSSNSVSFTVTVSAPPNTVPVFINTSPQTLIVYQNAGATSIAPLLHISDIDNGQTETWSFVTTPSHGNVIFSSATASSGSADITPGGTITYTPAVDYVGDDAFTVQVSDGVATATMVINITVILPPKIFVDITNGSDANDGKTWATAFKTFEKGVSTAKARDSIFVAKGIYQPLANQSFSMKEGVKIYGSFKGTEAGLADRIIGTAAADSSILKGNNAAVISNNNNGLTNAAVLNGFFITGGSNATGGGMINNNVSPFVASCIFSGNSGTQGGGIYNFFSAAATATSVVNCLFTGNTSTSSNGAGIYNNTTGAVTITNCSFSGNAGTAIYNRSTASGKTILIYNCSFSNNTTGINISPQSNTSVKIRNCILYGNGTGITNAVGLPAISYSLVQGKAAFNNGVDGSIDPLFVDAANGNLRLLPCSPVINMGNATGITSIVGSIDLAGNNRINGTIDMGAYEYSGETYPTDSLAKTNDSVTFVQSDNTATYYSRDCKHIIAKIVSNGSSPIAGSTTAYVWVESSVPTYMGYSYAPRHYQITPASNANASTATVTLYFTQADFDAYNAATTGLKLPTGSSDNIGIGNLRIAKYSGTTNNYTGLPDSYSEGSIIIDPDDNNIVWNSTGNRWEVSFDVSSFSGFLVTTPTTPLPVTWINLSAQLNSNKEAVISWEVNEQNAADYQIQKSTNGNNYTTIGSIKSIGNGTNSYSFTGKETVTGNTLYRIKQTDNDGTVGYSAIMPLQNNTGTTKVSIYPNPATHNASIRLYTDKAQTIHYKLLDNAGKILLQNTVLVSAGNTVIHITISNLASGMYHVAIKGDTLNTQLTLIKQ